MCLLYPQPGGVCLRAAQNHHWQDKKKWTPEEGVWSDVIGRKLRNHCVMLAKCLAASGSSWWWGWGEERWESWLEREPGVSTFQHFCSFKLISITILPPSSLFLSDCPAECSEWGWSKLNTDSASTVSLLCIYSGKDPVLNAVPRNSPNPHQRLPQGLILPPGSRDSVAQSMTRT